MRRLAILCLEDEPDVREALLRDLRPFAEHLRVEPAEDAEDARHVVAECRRDGDQLALALCDHVLPGETGVDFLIALNSDRDTAPVRKVLFTGQAGLEDTVRAINQGDLDHYIAKPWSVEELHRVVREQLTNFVIDQCEDLLPYVAWLDGPRLLKEVGRRASDR